MSTNRRQFLLSGAGLALGALPLSRALASSQQAPMVITVVEIANFNCSRCYAVNKHFDRLQKAAYEARSDLLFTPATWEGQSEWPSRVYYSIRDLHPAIEPLARNTIFEGIHEQGQIFETLSQVQAYFDKEKVFDKAKLVDPGFNWNEVTAYAQSNEPLYSEVRVSKLIELSGAQEVPTFIWIGDSKLIGNVSPLNAPEPLQLVAEVIRKMSVTQARGVK